MARSQPTDNSRQVGEAIGLARWNLERKHVPPHAGVRNRGSREGLLNCAVARTFEALSSFEKSVTLASPLSHL